MRQKIDDVSLQPICMYRRPKESILIGFVILLNHPVNENVN